jgi:hypothetical protein
MQMNFKKLFTISAYSSALLSTTIMKCNFDLEKMIADLIIVKVCSRIISVPQLVTAILIALLLGNPCFKVEFLLSTLLRK